MANETPGMFNYADAIVASLKAAGVKVSVMAEQDLHDKLLTWKLRWLDYTKQKEPTK